jgi:hypothetical protein
VEEPRNRVLKLAHAVATATRHTEQVRRPRLAPSWLVPGALCASAVLLAGALKVHFDQLLSQAAIEASGAVEPGGPGSATARAGAGGTADDVEGNGDAGERNVLGSAVASGVDELAAPASGAIEGAGAGGTSVGTGAPATDASGADDRAPGTGPGAAPGIDGEVWVDPLSSQRPWSDLGAVDGLLTFRGNPTRSWYGTGPVPVRPSIQWSVEIGCSQSAVAGEAKQWCGSGWTGQPAVFRSPTTDRWWLAFGAYNRAVNFLDPATGAPVLAPYPTGDIIKGSVTVDPDGYPLLYTGSRDDYFHVVALDQPQPAALWQLSAHAVEPTLWNNDWDGSALVIDDYLFEGGENGRFFVVKLNRGYGADGRVTVDPRIVFSTESWDSELLGAIGDVAVSVENSVAISGDVVYFANSGGLVQGWDISGLAGGEAPTRVFRFWTGDDTDASLVIDGDGMLYAVSQYERGTSRSEEVGQIMKLDPTRPEDPLVWSRAARANIGSGVWATPALYTEAGGATTLLIVPTNEGEVLGLDAATGAERWQLALPGPLWSSPVVVEDTLIQADCAGNVNAFDLGGRAPASTAAPRLLWSVALGGCIESTPAVWDGQVFVGTRLGSFYALGDG